MMDELDAAWHSELVRLDILKLPVDDYIDQYMTPLDAAEMSEEQRAQQVRPAMAQCISAMQW
jgi:hypothetical protein